MNINFSADVRNNGFLSFETKARTLYGAFVPASKVFFNPDVYVRNLNVLQIALDCLNHLQFSSDDIKQLAKYGVSPIFKNGSQAIKLAKKRNISIVFDKVSKPDIHAQWVHSKNTIVINEKYKNTRNMAEVYAISAALIHELAHAKDNDGITSVQEEINCLGMNALAFNIFRKKHPKIFSANSSPIIKDGVALYTDLFFGNNENALIDRIKLKYGDLPLESPNHSASDFAKKIIGKI